MQQHLDPERESYLNEILSRRSTLPVRTVSDEESLEAGVVFVVPSNRHINITDSVIEMHVDPAERPKPSIDMLMGTAANVFGEHLIAVVLTGTDSDGTSGARMVSEAGGTVIIQDAYLVKSASLEELLTVVHTAAESPAEAREENVVMVVPREAFQRAEKATEEGGLSARELEILLLVARGLSNCQISHTLNIAEATVKRHLANLYPKMGVSSRGEATRKALSEGWISARDVTGAGERTG